MSRAPVPVAALAAVGLAFALLGAHLYRGRQLALVAVAAALAGLLAVRRPWARRVAQLALLVATAEWLRTLIVIAGARLASGRPTLRLALILGAVALATFGAAVLLESRRARDWYGADRP